MIGRLFPTDIDWYDYLVSRPDLDEVNFWTPSGVGMKSEPLAPLLFKIKKNDGDAIGGFGLFASFRRMTILDAWRAFGEKNGSASLDEMRRRVGKYVGGRGAGLAPLEHQIGCIMLASPVFFPRDAWVRRPDGWPHNATLGKGYDLHSGEGQRVWRDCVATSSSLALSESTSSNLQLVGEQHLRGHSHLAFARLGQTTFREALVSAYGKCAVSREHSEPALDAAHIESYAAGGPSTLQNGLLLRADIHRLYDRHYVSVTPDHEFWVSERLRDEFANGTVYYDMARDQGRIALPADKRLWPDRERLAAHFDTAHTL